MGFLYFHFDLDFELLSAISLFSFTVLNYVIIDLPFSEKPFGSLFFPMNSVFETPWELYHLNKIAFKLTCRWAYISAKTTPIGPRNLLMCTWVEFEKLALCFSDDAKSLTETTCWAAECVCVCARGVSGWIVESRLSILTSLVSFSFMEHYPNWFQLENKLLRGWMFTSILGREAGVSEEEAGTSAFVQRGRMFSTFSAGIKLTSHFWTSSLESDWLVVSELIKNQYKSKCEKT